MSSFSAPIITCKKGLQNKPFVSYIRAENGPIVFIPAQVAIMVTHKKPIGVRLLWLRHTKSASPVPCWIALILILRFHEWIMKS
jgi:hypothetical protein